MWAILIERRGAGDLPRPASNRGFPGGPDLGMMGADLSHGQGAPVRKPGGECGSGPPRSRNGPRVSHGRDDP